MNVVQLGIPRVGGDCLFAAVGTPNTAVVWELIGPGVLHVISDVTSAAGVATVRWSSEGAVAGDQITVKVSEYA